MSFAEVQKSKDKKTEPSICIAFLTDTSQIGESDLEVKVIINNVKRLASFVKISSPGELRNAFNTLLLSANLLPEVDGAAQAWLNAIDIRKQDYGTSQYSKPAQVRIRQAWRIYEIATGPNPLDHLLPLPVAIETYSASDEQAKAILNILRGRIDRKGITQPYGIKIAFRNMAVDIAEGPMREEYVAAIDRIPFGANDAYAIRANYARGNARGRLAEAWHVYSVARDETP